MLLSLVLLPVRAINIDNTVWETNWNVMTFWQDENRVSAEYMFDGGIITGTLSGDTLRGWWREHDNAKECGPDSTWCGPLLFKFSPDGKSFTGSWGYCGTIPSTLDPEGGGLDRNHQGERGLVHTRGMRRGGTFLVLGGMQSGTV